MKLSDVVLALGIAVASIAPAQAELLLTGSTSNAGSYSTSELAALAASKTEYSFGGLSGIAVWDLLGGATPVSPNTPSTPNVSWGGISTSTPPGTATNNAILRYYVLATGSGGERSVVSLGEIAPVFGAVPAPGFVPAFVAFKDSSGTLLSTPELVVPSSSARGIDQLGALQLLSVPAIGGPGGQSTSITLTGDSVTSPGTYSVDDLKTEFTSINVVANGNEYIGIPLWSFLDPNTTDIMDKLVVVKGTDGYQVVHALAELDPSKGGDPFILLAYDDEGGDLNPGNADCCRTILPGDTARRGRWMSNLYEIAVIDAPTATPLPASWTMMLLGLAGLGAAKLRRAKKSLVPAEGV